MNNQPAEPTNLQENFELRIRTLRILWLGFFLSMIVYFGISRYIGPRENIEPNQTASLILAVIALSTTLASFVIKSKLIARAIELQQVPLVQQAYVLAWALNEAAALFGLLDFFMTDNRYYYVPFIVGALGLLLHFPRREHVVNAWAKTPIV